MRSDVELLRIIAAFGIVLFHSRYSFAREVSYSSLIIFIIFSSYFSTISTKKHSVVQRALRLLLPCVIWSILYAVLNIFQGKKIFFDEYNVLSSILSTSSIHLWYLPYVFFCIVLIDFIKVYVSYTSIAFFSITVSSFLLITSPVWRCFNYISPFGQYIHAFPAVLIGVLFGLLHNFSFRKKFIFLSVLFVSLFCVYFMQVPGVSTTYLIGTLACSILLEKDSILPKYSFIFEVSKLTFGVYLIHIIILMFFRYYGFSGLFLAVNSFLISSVVVYFIKKVLPKRIIIYIF